MEWHNVDQNSDEWYSLRAGKLTFSNLGKVMANLGKPFGDPARKLAVQIAVEQITGIPQESSYTNDHMARGHEEEPIARMLYEQETFCTVDNGGFFDAGTHGCSPDGIVGDGIIEIKSAVPNIHYDRVRRGAMDPTYKWQCYGNLMLTEKDWIDFISYCGTFPEDGKLFIFRAFADELQDEFAKIRARVDEFIALIEDTKKTIERSEYSLIRH